MGNDADVVPLAVLGLRGCPEQGVDGVLAECRKQAVSNLPKKEGQKIRLNRYLYFFWSKKKSHLQHIKEDVQLDDTLALDDMIHHGCVDV